MTLRLHIEQPEYTPLKSYELSPEQAAEFKDSEVLNFDSRGHIVCDGSTCRFYIPMVRWAGTTALYVDYGWTCRSRNKNHYLFRVSERSRTGYSVRAHTWLTRVLQRCFSSCSSAVEPRTRLASTLPSERCLLSAARALLGSSWAVGGSR